ncbi:MAG: putative immunity protein [Peptostreptococcales bacterium]
MIDMNKFTLTKHDDELLDIIKPVKQYSNEHKILALWAINCLNRILPLFEVKYPNEIILKTAVGTLQKWINGEIKMWDARKYTYTVLALAKTMEKEDKPYSQIVRATSHCLATCHVPTHSEGTAMYVISAIKLLNKGKGDVVVLMENERVWQINHLKELMKNHV